MLIVPPALTNYKTPFDPLSLFVGVAGDWFLASDFSTMWQDTAATVPVTAVGQSVARWDSKSGSGRYVTRSTAGEMPLLQQDVSGYYYLVFDGVDDELFSPSTIRTYTVGAGSFVGACFSFPTAGIGGAVFGAFQNDGNGGSVDNHRLSYTAASTRANGQVRGGPNNSGATAANAVTGTMPLNTAAVATTVLNSAGTSVDISTNNSVAATAAPSPAFGAVNFASQCGFGFATTRMQSTGTNSDLRIYGALAAASITNQNRANAARYLGSLAGLRV